MKISVITLCAQLLSLLLSAHTVQAQSRRVGITPFAASRHSIILEVALEPELVVSLDYIYGLGALDRRNGISVGAGVKVPTTVISNDAWRLHLFTSTHWGSRDHWGANLTALGYLSHNRNRAGEIHGFGIELRAAPGFYGSRRTTALDLGWQGTLLSHIRHSAETRATFEDRYPPGVNGPAGPKDGWYGSTAHRFRIGLLGAHKLADRMALQVALGSLFARQKQGVFLGFDFAQIPVYLETSLRFGW
ncbi:hypothetical protein L0337_29930 [candidate division KSB1 bacterium]|nr:hypothetical protein [candidate division KSB1 bacterium]